MSTQGDMFNAFLFLSDNTDVEWRLDYFMEGESPKYTLGTKHDTHSDPSSEALGHKTSSVISFVHSHPDIKPSIQEEIWSMGWFGDNIRGDADLKNYKPAYEKLNYYTYFPNSGRLWSVEKYYQPSYIRNINGNHKRFFFGTFNKK